MPRINLDDELFNDGRFRNYCNGRSEAFSIGEWVLACKLAQTYWIPEKKIIPEKVFMTMDFAQRLLDHDLAEKRENGVYFRGTEDQFAWWFICKENGEKGGRPVGKITRLKPDGNQMVTSGLAPATSVEPALNPPSPSPSPSPYIKEKNTLSNDDLKSSSILLPSVAPLGVKKIKTKPSSSKKADKNGALVKEVIGLFITKWEAKYDTKFDVGGIEAGCLKKFALRSKTIERASELIDQFLYMEDNWFTSTAHSPECLIKRFNLIQSALTSTNCVEEMLNRGNINYDRRFEAIPDDMTINVTRGEF